MPSGTKPERVAPSVGDRKSQRKLLLQILVDIEKALVVAIGGNLSPGSVKHV